MLILKKENYEKNKKVLKAIQLECWDGKKYEAKSHDNFKVEIIHFSKISDEKIDEFREIVKGWGKEIQGKKLLNDKNLHNISYGDFTKWLNEMAFNSKLELEQRNDLKPQDNNYYWAFLKHGNTYLTVGFFGIPKCSKPNIGVIELLLSYPKTQYVKEIRQKGDFSNCNEYLNVKIIEYIFTYPSIGEVIAEPATLSEKNILRQLGFKENKTTCKFLKDKILTFFGFRA